MHYDSLRLGLRPGPRLVRGDDVNLDEDTSTPCASTSRRNRAGPF